MRRVLFAIVTTVAGLVLLLGFKSTTTRDPASHSLVLGAGIGGPDGSGGPAPDGAGGSTGPGSSGSTSDGSGGGGGGRTVTGDAEDTPYGPVQVRVTLSGGRITYVSVVRVPQDSRRDLEINSYAVPILNQEALRAANAHIDVVSGATYTSEGYIQSLQSALDRA